jgi:hypothetical protein
MDFVGTAIGVVFGSVGLLIALVVGQAWGPVSRGQLLRFARRQELVITPTNGELVIRYLAHTRRWRAAGVVAGIAVAAAANLSVGWWFVTALFVGWFIGAIIAEARLAAGPPGARRVASLQPRTFHRYVDRFSWYLLPVALLFAVAVAIVAIPEARAVRQITLLVLAIGITAIVMVTRSRIVARAQPYERAELIAADDAIRSRALHVVSGGGAALVLMCVGAQLHFYAMSASSYPVAEGLAAVATYGGALIGWMIGTARFRAPARPRLTLAA